MTSGTDPKMKKRAFLAAAAGTHRVCCPVKRLRMKGCRMTSAPPHAIPQLNPELFRP
jgi:hypothetical protein